MIFFGRYATTTATTTTTATMIVLTIYVEKDYPTWVDKPIVATWKTARRFFRRSFYTALSLLEGEWKCESKTKFIDT